MRYRTKYKEIDVRYAFETITTAFLESNAIIIDLEDLNDIMALACGDGPPEVVKLECKIYEKDGVG